MYETLIKLVEQSLMTYANYYSEDTKNNLFNNKLTIKKITEKTLEKIERAIDKQN